jgi:acyl-CoA reductase-like NAD-dependent aldehyde dehydrogenase
MTVGLVINGKVVEKEETVPLISPGSGKTVERISKGTKDDVKEAVEAARASFEAWSETPLNKRSAVLLKAAALLRERGEDFALTLASEAGKPIRDRDTIAINKAMAEAMAEAMAKQDKPEAMAEAPQTEAKPEPEAVTA